MPRIKIEMQQYKNGISIEVSKEITIKEILETFQKDLQMNINFEKIIAYLNIQKRYVDIDVRLDEEGIVDNEIIVLGER